MSSLKVRSLTASPATSMFINGIQSLPQMFGVLVSHHVYKSVFFLGVWILLSAKNNYVCSTYSVRSTPGTSGVLSSRMRWDTTGLTPRRG